jgi:hypothetical protein
MRDGADTEMVVAALLHDIGDDLSPENHSQVAAAIIRPYVRAEVTWVVNMHGIFQMKYYGHHIDLDPDLGRHIEVTSGSTAATISVRAGIRSRSIRITPLNRSRPSSQCCTRYSPASRSIPTWSANPTFRNRRGCSRAIVPAQGIRRRTE